ncbi:MAG: flagellar basal-body MS-ring/collar protein FliF, partial [Oscillospiraceae bacterium]
MNEHINKIVSPLKEFWAKQDKKRRIILISSIAAIVIIAIVVVAMLNTKQYVVLFDNLSTTETREAFAALGEDAAKCKQDGNKLLVEKKSEPSVRMAMATAGYPKDVPNNDYLKDNKDFMSTDSDRRIAAKQNLEIRIKDTIETIDGVEQAIVTLVTTEDNNVVWQTDTSPATASVMLTLKSGVKLDPKQVSGIKTLVATGVRGILVKNVSISDQTGNVLQDASETNYVDINNFKLAIQQKFESDMKKEIGEFLSPVYGANNFTLKVTADMDLDEKIQEIIKYTPSTDDGKGVLSEGEKSEEAIKPGDAAGGVPGEQTNADLPNYVGITKDEKNIYYKDYENYKYLVNKATEQITSQAAKMQNLTVTVAINRKARVLNQQSLANLQLTVANAAAISPAKVAISNEEFAGIPDLPEVKKKPLLSNTMIVFLMTLGTTLLLIAIISIFVINHKIKKNRLEAAILAEQQAQERELLFGANNIGAGTGMNTTPLIDMPNMEEDLKNQPESKEQALKKEIQDFSIKNPEIVAQLLRT